MPGKTTRLTALATRKQLLVFESNLNRELLQVELGVVKKEIHGLTGGTGAFGSWLGMARQIPTTLAGLLHGLLQHDPPPDQVQPSRFTAILHHLRAGVELWSGLRAHWR